MAVTAPSNDAACDPAASEACDLVSDGATAQQPLGHTGFAGPTAHLTHRAGAEGGWKRTEPVQFVRSSGQ